MAAVNVPRLLEDLSDVSSLDPDDGQALVWDGVEWVPTDIGLGSGIVVVDCANDEKIVRMVSNPATDVTGNAREASIKILTQLGGSQASVMIQCEKAFFSNGFTAPGKIEGNTVNGVTILANNLGVFAGEPSFKMHFAPDYTALFDTNLPGRLTVCASATNQTPQANVGANGQTANLQSWCDYTKAVLTAILASGAVLLVTLADAAAPNGSLFLGSDHLDGAGAPRLCRKSSAGTVTVIG